MKRILVFKSGFGKTKTIFVFEKATKEENQTCKRLSFANVKANFKFVVFQFEETSYVTRYLQGTQECCLFTLGNKKSDLGKKCLPILSLFIAFYIFVVCVSPDRKRAMACNRLVKCLGLTHISRTLDIPFLSLFA